MNATSSSSPDTPLREGDIIGLFGTVGAIENGQVMVQFDDPNHSADDVVPFDASTLRLVRRITKVGDVVLNPQNERVIVHNISNGNMAHVTKEGSDLEEAGSYQTLRIGQLTHIGQVSESQFGSGIAASQPAPAPADKPAKEETIADAAQQADDAPEVITGPDENAPAPQGEASIREETDFDLNAAQSSNVSSEPANPPATPQAQPEPKPAPSAAPEVPAASVSQAEERPVVLPAGAQEETVSTAAEAAPAAEEVPATAAPADNTQPGISAAEYQSEQDEAESAVANIREAKNRGSALFERTDLSKLRRQPEEP